MHIFLTIRMTVALVKLLIATVKLTIETGVYVSKGVYKLIQKYGK
jgi:hypothetical protein